MTKLAELTYEEVGTHTALGIDAARRWGGRSAALVPL